MISTFTCFLPGRKWRENVLSIFQKIHFFFFAYKFLVAFLCICLVCVHKCVALSRGVVRELYLTHRVHMKFRGQPWESVLSLCRVDPRNQTGVLRHCGKNVDPLRDLASLALVFI